MLLFSPKSACSTAVIWFFKTMGLYEKALAYDPWPHKFRIQVYYSRPESVAATEIPLDELTVLRIVRDPVQRAVSSFRHVVGTGYADKQLKKIAGIDVAERGLSLNEYIDFLEKEDLRSCNPHHRIQKHPIEDIRAPDYVINISRSDLFEEINRFELSQGMPRTDFAALKWIHRLENKRAATRKPEIPNAASRVLTRREVKGGLWPANLLNEEARQRLRALYATDIEAYGETA